MGEEASSVEARNRLTCGGCRKNLLPTDDIRLMLSEQNYDEKTKGFSYEHDHFCSLPCLRDWVTERIP
jgi:hypothetical protein